MGQRRSPVYVLGVPGRNHPRCLLQPRILLSGEPLAFPYSRKSYAYKLHFRQDYALMPLPGSKRRVWEIKGLRGLPWQGHGLNPARIWLT